MPNDRDENVQPRTTEVLERAIARANFRRQVANATIDELKELACQLGILENDYVN